MSDNVVLTTLIILVASVVLGTGVVLYGTSLFQEEYPTHNNVTNSTSHKQIVNYHMALGDRRLVKPDHNETSIIVAVSDNNNKVYLTNGKVLTIFDKQVDYWKNGVLSDYINMYDDNIVGDKIIAYYYGEKSSCEYVFDWTPDFQSTYPIETFNFTQIPNATNYDFKFDSSSKSACDGTQQILGHVEIFSK